jgi:hypothetical protein
MWIFSFNKQYFSTSSTKRDFSFLKFWHLKNNYVKFEKVLQYYELGETTSLTPHKTPIFTNVGVDIWFLKKILV